MVGTKWHPRYLISGPVESDHVWNTDTNFCQSNTVLFFFGIRIPTAIVIKKLAETTCDAYLFNKLAQTQVVINSRDTVTPSVHQ